MVLADADEAKRATVDGLLLLLRMFHGQLICLWVHRTLLRESATDWDNMMPIRIAADDTNTIPLFPHGSGT